jgi:hypothetical protein
MDTEQHCLTNLFTAVRIGARRKGLEMDLMHAAATCFAIQGLSAAFSSCSKLHRIRAAFCLLLFAQFGDIRNLVFHVPVYLLALHAYWVRFIHFTLKRGIVKCISRFNGSLFVGEHRGLWKERVDQTNGSDVASLLPKVLSVCTSIVYDCFIGFPLQNSSKL